MDYIAIRMLTGDRLKYFGLVAGLTFAAFLMTQQGSIFNGYVKRTVAWLDDTPQADIWVMDPHVEFSEDRIPILDAALYRVRGMAGVEWATPLFKGFRRIRLPDGTNVSCRMVGIDDDTLMAGPPTMVQGKREFLREDKAVLVDETELGTSLKLKKGLPGEGPRPLRVGDRIDINDNEAVVAGTFTRSREFFWEPVVYTTYSRAVKFSPYERKQMNYVMAKVTPGYDPQEVAGRIAASTGLKALTREDFRSQAMWFILDRTGIIMNFGLSIALGFTISVLISGMLLYSFVLDNLRYYGALKAMGATNGMLIRMIFVQILFSGGVGYGIGAGSATLIGNYLVRLDLAYNTTWHILAFGATGVLLCTTIAAIISLARVLRLEPGMVFKA